MDDYRTDRARRIEGPFEEMSQRIAFITRTNGVCQQRRNKECTRGDLLLNVIEVNPYSVNMRFRLFTTHFEACMDEGIRDDYVQKSITTVLTSARGLDVTFINQYRDRVIFDCITYVDQKPIRFPRLPKTSVEE